MLSFLRTKLTSYTILFVSIFLSVLVYTNILDNTKEKEKIHFKSISEQATMLIKDRIESYRQVLYAGAALFYASDDVNKDEWRQFYTSAKVSRVFSGIQGLSYSPFFKKEDKVKNIANMRIKGHYDFSINPDGERDYYAPLAYIEPIKGNERAVGYDPFSDKTRREGILNAIYSGQVSISDKIFLVQKAGEAPKPAFLMYVPIYTKDAPLSTLQDRIEATVGLVSAPFYMNELLDGVLQKHHLNITFEIYDGTNTTPENLLYGDLSLKLPKSDFFYQTSIQMDGRTWTLVFKPLQGFLNEAKSNVPLFTLALGVVLSLFIFSITFSLVTTNEKAEKLAKEITQELFISEERLRLAIQGTGDDVWDYDILSGKVYVSKQVQGYFKSTEDMPKEAESIDFRDLDVAIHKDDVDEVLRKLQEHFEGKSEFFISEHRIVRGDGEYIWVLARGVVLYRDEDGNPLRISGTSSDVTQRKTIEAALKAERDYTANIIKETPVFVRGVDANGICTFINPAGERISGYKADEIIGKNWWEVLYPDDANQNTHKMQELLLTHGDTSNSEMTMTCKNGEQRIILWNHLVHYDNNGNMIENIGFGHDITERKRFEEILKKSELSLRKAHEIAKLGSWELDLNTKTLTCNDEVYHIFDINKTNNPPSIDLFFSKMLFDEGKISFTEFVTMVKDTKKYTNVHRIVTSDGIVKWAKLVIDLEYSLKGAPLFARGTIQDITEQVRMNQELEESNRKLKLKSKLLEELSMSDGLTKIPNRRYFDEAYEREFKNMQRTSKPLTIMIADVDYFKAYNDFYGHARGDKCLIAIAQALKNTLKRPTDIVARYGGEEFVILLSDSDLEGSKTVANELMNAVNKLNILHESSSITNRVTISIGMAFTSDEYPFTKEVLFEQADDALYFAKANGRNQCALYDVNSATIAKIF